MSAQLLGDVAGAVGLHDGAVDRAQPLVELAAGALYKGALPGGRGAVVEADHQLVRNRRLGVLRHA